MRLHGALLLHALFSSAALAVFADDAYHVDYHYALLGYPQQHATFFQQPLPGSKASLIYTLSERHVLGAVNPKDGSIVWRQALAPTSNSSSAFLRAGDGQDTIISAVDGQIAAWRASDGRAAWTTSAGAASIRDMEILELEDGLSTTGAKDAIVLSQESVPIVSRLDGSDGRVKWQYEDNSGDTPFQLSASATNIYYISLHGTMLGNQKIKVQSLNSLTGQKVDQYTLSSDSELSSSNLVLFTGANTASPLIVWTDKAHKVLKVHIIGTKSTASFNIENGSGSDVLTVSVHAPSHITALTHFLVHYQTAESNWAEVYHVDLKKQSVSKAYDLPRLSGKATFTTSSVDANVYFTRITEDEMITVSSVSHGILGRWAIPVRASAASEKVVPVHGISEVAIRAGAAQAVRSAVLLSNGTWALIRNGETGWLRPEVLAGATSAVWADFPEEKALAHELEIEGHQNAVTAYIHRCQRHITDLQHLPAYILSIPKRVSDNFKLRPVHPKDAKSEPDTFGFHKILVLTTSDDRVVALDAGSAGRILWNLPVRKLVGVDKLSSPKLKALPGGLVEVRDVALPDSGMIFEAVSGNIVQAQKTTGSTNTSTGPQVLIEYALNGNSLEGFTKDGKAKNVLWSFTPPSGDRIASFVARPYEDPVASIGRVLGDRRVLYKYLNPNLVLVTSISDTQPQASFYLLDSSSGNILHSAYHENVDTTRPITSTISENWLTYSYTVGSDSASRGPVLVVAELFESDIPDDRGPLGESGNFSSVRPIDAVGDVVKPHVVSKAYHIPEEISHMTVTHTKQGITSRELLVTLPDSFSIVGVPRQVLDPRRPIGRDPTSSEAMEGLTKYVPIIPIDSKWYLNHKRELIGIRDVITSPSLLESTSLVFAYGLDVFGTRVSPSFAFDVLGKDFNKSQMLITVAALFIGVLVVGPLVRRKQINSQWQTL